MFGSSKKIIYVTKGKFSAYEVSGKKVKAIIENSNLTKESINPFFADLVKQKTEEIRLLFAEDVSYNIAVSVNDLGDIAKAGGTKKAIYENFSKRVPEKLDDKVWSFTKLDDEKFLAFTPIMSYYEFIAAHAKQNKLKISLVESVKISSTRNENPVIGIAMKEVASIPKPVSTPKQVKIKDNNTAEGEKVSLRKQITDPKNKVMQALIPVIIVLTTIAIVLGVLANSGIIELPL